MFTTTDHQANESVREFDPALAQRLDGQVKLLQPTIGELNIPSIDGKWCSIESGRPQN